MRRGLAIGIVIGLAPLLWLVADNQAAAHAPPGRPAVAMAGVPRAHAIYPEQTIALRFDHAEHLDLGVKCAQCHEKATGSNAVSDYLVPKEAKCAECHDIAEARAGKKTDPPSACAVCHPGFDASANTPPVQSDLPPANLHFSHAKHLARKIECTSCHGSFEKVELATRDQLPKMATCLTCHDGREASLGCRTCHLAALPSDGSAQVRGSPIQTKFESGTLRPDAWNPLGLDHGPRFDRSHGLIAQNRREQCMSCHTERECSTCHDGTTKPMAIHPNDWISIHAVAGRMDEPHCDSCHRRQSFCVSCHERAGIGVNADPKFYQAGSRVHPPQSVWVGEVKGGVIQVGPMHHGVQAARNMSTCVSCHREEQCTRCHSAKGTNAPGSVPVSPFDAFTTGFPHQPVHPRSYSDAKTCRDMLAKNAQACRKCHTLSPNDSIAKCFVSSIKGSGR